MTLLKTTSSPEEAVKQPKRITVLREVIRADGTREGNEIIAYMSFDPKEMKKVLQGKILPPGIAEEDNVAGPKKVTGACTMGKKVIDLLNEVNKTSPKTARKISKLNDKQMKAMRSTRRWWQFTGKSRSNT